MVGRSGGGRCCSEGGRRGDGEADEGRQAGGGVMRAEAETVGCRREAERG